MDRETLEKICLGFPGTSQDIKWEKDLCYLVGDKMFAVTGTHPPFAVSFKATEEAFGELTERPGIQPAPYLARYHWVHVSDTEALNREEWHHYLEESWRQVLGKMSRRKQKEILGE